jgi:hypothetical protein
MVLKVIIENLKAVGVQVQIGGKNGLVTEIRAKKEVVVCGGAINTPQLLMLSGIGPKAHLEEMGSFNKFLFQFVSFCFSFLFLLETHKKNENNVIFFACI